ncbi:MAG TPA: DUF4236 domain-containing protein [Solirubrobacterales bacterium]
MGFYVRKSVKAGPFRFNLSRSGVGISVGVPGFSAGAGPRGNYVRVGNGGVQYRSTLRGSPENEAAWRPPPPPPVAEVLLEDVTGASASELVPTGPGDLVEQLNIAAGRWRTVPWVIGFLILILLARPVAGTILLLPGIPLVVWLWFQDRARRTVVAFYDVNDTAADWFQRVVDSTQGLAANDFVWRVDASGDVQTTYQYKVNAGATTIVSRSVAKVSLEPPPILATNIAVPSIVVGKAGIFFLPDRVLVKDGKRFSDASYGDLEMASGHLRFNESGAVPRDAHQVDATWQYVNVDGGPDRRFKNNRQYPVMLYGEFVLASRGGLFWLVQCSRPPSAEVMVSTLRSPPAALAEVVDA